MKKYLLFDLDGTLTDPKIGITTCVQYALNSFGIEEPDLDKLEPFIGPPLRDSFMEFYGFTAEQAEEAVAKYRERFQDTGLFENEVPVESITVMVQKEVADRMQTGPGNKDYGALSLAVQYYADPYIVANVPPNCFMPRPNVDSAVIKLTRHKEPTVNVADEKLMFKIIRASFNQRRKILVNGLKNSPELSFSKEQIVKAIEKIGKPETIRGEALTLEEFAELANAFTELK